jgi:membrane protein DedA with SNARE-associated domain
MTDETSFQMSQGYDVVPPRPGRAYPILCEEWDYLKTQIQSISTNFGFYHTIGSLLVGSAISTLVAILSGGFPVTEGGNNTSLIIAWSVVAVTAVTGGICLFFAHESRTISEKKASEVITQMELIEKRYESGDNG